MNVKEKLKGITILNKLYVSWKWRERRVSHGKENPDKIFFVIRRAQCKAGLFSLVMTNMGLVKYALDKGYIPVIDMQSERNTYLEEEQVGRENAWEFYFEQPCGYSLKDIERSRNIILSRGTIRKSIFYPGDKMVRNPDEYQMWRSLFQRCFHVKKELLEEEQILKKEMFQGKRVLGVLCRGTDYTNTRPKNHPIQPKTEDVIEKVNEVLEQQKCTYVYLATEDDDIYSAFEKRYGEKLKALKTRRYHNTGKENINDISAKCGESRYLLGRDYLMTILLLADCNCLVAGSAGGTYGALLMGSEYEYCYIFDLGTY